MSDKNKNLLLMMIGLAFVIALLTPDAGEPIVRPAAEPAPIAAGAAAVTATATAPVRTPTAIGRHGDRAVVGTGSNPHSVRATSRSPAMAGWNPKRL